jgi:ATP-binding cassette subfamily A (ABC1) protein 3
VQIFKAVEQDKETFGIMYYSVSQASLEQVFLKIVGEHDVAEEGYDG